ncbi:WD40 domain-containing protein denticleless [Lycorma delicatula]|uniref:WD40 domain-containing protein denticleless n=1 Tax=Lycorma delicatula TaxID=130591 RepID=UPI003F515765
MNVVSYVESSRYGFAEKMNYDLLIKRLICARKINSTLEENDNNSQITSSLSMTCKFAKNKGNEGILAIANEDGNIFIEDTNSKKSPQLMYNFFAHNNAVFDMAWSDVDSKLVVGSGDHTATLWEISRSRPQAVCGFAGHSKSIKSVCFIPNEKHLFATGARDGLILLWDARNPSPNTAKIKPYNIIKSYNWRSSGTEVCRGRNKKAATSADSISSLLFQNSSTLLSCSVGEGAVKVWDIRKWYSAYKRVPQPVHTLAHPTDITKNCFTSLALDPSGMRLYANCIDSTIYCYNVCTFSTEPVAKYTGHQVHSLYVRCSLSPDGRYLVSGSSDGKAYIWGTDRSDHPVVALTGHSSEVTSVDWSQSTDIKIATCSDDLPIDNCSLMAMTWQVETCNIDEDLNRIRNEAYTNGGQKLYGWAEEINKSLVPRKPLIPKYFRFPKSCHDSSSSLSNSPTADLPNYVIDGTSPHHRCNIESRQKENRNWLCDIKNKTPPAVQKESSHRTGQKRPRQNNPKVYGNLLKFFKVSTRESAATPLSQLNDGTGDNSSPSEH